MSYKVKQPTGLTITRSGSKFKATWKEPEAYAMTKYHWGYQKNGKFKWLDGHKTSTKRAELTISGNVEMVAFRVCGFGLPGHAIWSAETIKKHYVYAPYRPTITANFVQTAMTTFTWNMVEDKNHDRPTSSAKLQTILVQDCPSGEKALASLKQWKTATTTTVGVNGSITPVNGAGEDTGLISGKSYTRVVRVKEIGLGGESDWRYATHIYADPYPAKNVEGRVTRTEASLNCEMSWTTPTDAGHPIDTEGVVPEWAIATPAAGMECRDDTSFEQLPAQSSTSGVEKKTFTLDTAIGVDKCLFLRVTTKHDTAEIHSIPVLAKGDSVGPLADPEFTEAPSITSSTVTIKASNESEVPDSFVVDFLERADGSVEVLGLHDMATKVYQVTGIENARVGIKAYVGTWDSALKEVQGVLMESPMIWSAGNVPVAPSLDDFDVEQSIVPNTVLVSWGYSWDDADACEISWSTEPDAWISTEDPESYVVLRGLENKLAIKGIEAGEPLYVRIRYLDGVDEDAILSPYSDIKSITISTVPAVPKLNLEKQFFTQGEDITCSWIYVTTDGTEQAQAQIAERIVTTEGGESVVTYQQLKEVATEQKTVIKNEWQTGTQHSLAVKVANGSGNWSDWSEAVTITIAEPITCEITETSLVYDEIPINPETYTGNPITFDSGEQEKEVASLHVDLLPVQDLHGYDKPWSAGAGKNKLQELKTSYGSTATGAFYVDISAALNDINYFALTAGKTYTLSFDMETSVLPCNISAGCGDGRYQNDIKTEQVSSNGRVSITFTPTETQLQNRPYFAFRPVRYGAATDFTWSAANIQLEEGSTPTAWTPYTNICPITGRTQTEITDRGKNLLPIKAYTGVPYNPSAGTAVAPTEKPTQWTDNNDGTFTMTLSSWEQASFITPPLAAGKSTIRLTTVTAGMRIGVYVVDADNTVNRISTIRNGSSANELFQVTTTLTEGQYFAVYVAGGSGSCTIKEPQCEYGETATSYAPYKSTTKTVTLPHTVYGADVDVTGGEGKETLKLIDASTLGWNYDTSGKRWQVIVSDIYNYPSRNATLWSDRYSADTTATTGDEGKMFTVGKGVYIYSTDGTNAPTGQLCYPLATPTDLQTTPTDVELLTGVNNISADGDMTLTIVDDIEKGDYLKSLPMTATVTGAGTGGRTTLMIARRGDYRIERPEGEDFKGHDGEVVYQNVYPGEAQQEIQLEDLQGDLDDGARYVIRASIEDDYGQSDSDEIEFTVNWDHKAIKPSATVVVTDIAKITIAESEDAEESDYVDIYRQSIDGTELIYTGANFGETYVDPYPTIGNFGYLIVGRNAYGDFIMEESTGDHGQFAWYDLPAGYESERTLIDFNGERIQLYYNVDVSHSWNKDFKKTKYLGGSIVGDYVAGVERTGDINAVSVPILEPDMLESMRRLAEYEGNCHIRTKEGSSFTACVQVSEEDNHDKAGFVRSFSISVEKVEPVELDGMTEEEWEAQDAVEQGL